MNSKRTILLRVRLAFILSFLFATAIIYRIFSLQTVEGERWRKVAAATSLQYRTIPSTRGNIYSDNGSLLATSLPFYKVCLDPTVASDELFDASIDSLSLLLSKFYGDRSQKEYRERIKTARAKNRRYLVLNRVQVGYQDKKVMETWPLFREGRYRGGVLFEKADKRFRPFSNLAGRTIGYVNDEGFGAGLERSFHDKLRGLDGEALFTKRAGGSWVQVFNDQQRRPQEGLDIVTTLDVNLQDVSESALLKHLQMHEADRGCVVVMEVATGHIKAMANLSRNKNGYYGETYNYAVGSHGLREPGSTFKLASLMALLEDSHLQIADTIDTGDGVLKFYKEVVRDHKPGGYGKITIEDAFEKSSNIAFAKLVDSHFGLKPQKFMEYVRRFGLSDPLDFQLMGEGIPKFPTEDRWSGITLPWMAYGYGFEITPLQTLTFYNAVANNGKMMKPTLVSAVRRANQVEEQIDPYILNEQIASPQTLESVHQLLAGVVESGTASNIRNAHYGIAGKTGTAQTLENGRYVRKYYTSFVGYFPTDKPKYSCIVVIDNPKGYSQYGSDVAAPVFKEIADKIYARDLEIHEAYLATVDSTTNQELPVIQAGFLPELVDLCAELDIRHEENPDADWGQTKVLGDSVAWQGRANSTGRVPDVRGMLLRDAIYLLENGGLQVNYRGSGRVSKQSLLPGDKIIKGSYIQLSLK
jgi:cell division protein FtsI (penicillin-binding protein 3)